jgi:hypothetical protein
MICKSNIRFFCSSRAQDKTCGLTLKNMRDQSA